MNKKLSSSEFSPEEVEKRLSKIANTVNEDSDDKYKVGDIDICNSCSGTDCTGLAYRPPQNEYEADSYQEVYSFGPPEIKKKEK